MHLFALLIILINYYIVIYIGPIFKLVICPNELLVMPLCGTVTFLFERIVFEAVNKGRSEPRLVYLERADLKVLSSICKLPTYVEKAKSEHYCRS